jgi:hypothetical protein
VFQISIYTVHVYDFSTATECDKDGISATIKKFIHILISVLPQKEEHPYLLVPRPYPNLQVKLYDQPKDHWGFLEGR